VNNNGTSKDVGYSKSNKNISLKNFLFRVYIIQYRIDSENIQQS